MFVTWRSWRILVAVVIALTTALSIFHFIRSQAIVQPLADIVAAIAVADLAGLLAGICAYIAVRLFDFLAGRSLIDVLKGDEPVSIRWVYLAILGVILGGIAASFTRMAILLLLPLISP
jgi:H+/Cl- antiporter ClcA